MEREYKYVDGTPLATRIASMLKLCFFATVVGAVGRARQFVGILRSGSESIPLADVQAKLADGGILSFIGSVGNIVYLVAFVHFLIWLRRASINARALGATGFRQSPGWSWGNFLIPVWRLFKPYSFMEELSRRTYKGMTDAGVSPEAGERLPERISARIWIWNVAVVVMAVIAIVPTVALVVEILRWPGLSGLPVESPLPKLDVMQLPISRKTLSAACGLLFAQDLLTLVVVKSMGVYAAAVAAMQYAWREAPAAPPPGDDGAYGWPDEKGGR